MTVRATKYFICQTEFVEVLIAFILKYVQVHNTVCNQCYSMLYVYLIKTEIGLGVVVSATTISWPSLIPSSGEIQESTCIAYKQSASIT